MTYPKRTWGPGTTREQVTNAKLQNIEDGVYEVDQITRGIVGDPAGGYPFTVSAGLHMPCSLLAYASRFTFGTAPVTSDGYFILPTPAVSYLFGTPGWQQSFSVQNTSSSTAASLINSAFLLPALTEALSLSKISGVIRIACRPALDSDAQVTEVKVLTIKVASDGTETTLNTQTDSTARTVPINFQPGGGVNPLWGVIESPFSWDSSGSPQTIAATARLGIRVQIKAKSVTNLKTTYYAINSGPGLESSRLAPVAYSDVAFLFA